MNYLKYLRYLHFLVYLNATSQDAAFDSMPVANFFVAFHSEILAKEMRELVNRIISEINTGVEKELCSQAYKGMDVKVIIHIGGDSYQSYIRPVCPATSTPESFHFYWKVIGSYNEKLLNDLYLLLSTIADTRRRTLPAIPDISSLAKDLEVKHYGILHNNQADT